VQKELDSMKKSAGRSRKEDAAFGPMRLGLDCLLFMRTKPPVEPVEFSRRICEDAKLVSDRGQRKSRFINRFIPIKGMGKATDNGVEEVARAVLVEHFQLAGFDETPLDKGDKDHSVRATPLPTPGRSVTSNSWETE
jgi:tRNA acetyltransferase TAN1